jgi:hypothetical protein
MQSLTGCAVAELRGEGLRAANLVLHLAAVALAFPDGVEGRVGVDAVRRAVFPCIFGEVGAGACLVLMLACVSFL